MPFATWLDILIELFFSISQIFLYSIVPIYGLFATFIKMERTGLYF